MAEPRDIEPELELEHRHDPECRDRHEIGERRRFEVGADATRFLIERDALGQLVAATEHERAVGITELLRAVTGIHEVEEPQRAAGVKLGCTSAGGGKEQLERSLDGSDLRACPGEHGHEAAEHVVHHREDQRVAIGEVDVERPARQAGPRADRVEAGIEAMARELLEGSRDERDPRGGLGFGALRHRD